MGYLAVVYSVFEQVSYNMLSTDFILNIIVSGAESSNTIISILLTLLPLGLFIVYFRFIFGYFSRSFERQSDLYALKLKGTSAGIINSLEKIAWVSSINKYAPNWHHYGIYERIQFLQQCAAQPSLIGRHDRKVSVMLIAYTLVLIGLSSVLYGSNAQNLQHSKITFVQKVLEKQVQQYPANPLYQFSLGNLYFEIGKIKEAEIYYKNALTLNPDDPEVLNNLAWLYATARDAEFRNPQEALSLSKKAAALDPKPHILDTLGESYYINGQYAEAVNALELAIRKKPDNIEYYKKQLNKFKKSLDQQGEEDSDQDQQPEDDDQRFAI
jgi:tetratricopeptide (TPR) repeat protein